MADKILFQPTSTAQAIQDFYGGKNLYVPNEQNKYVNSGITYLYDEDTGKIIINGTVTTMSVGFSASSSFISNLKPINGKKLKVYFSNKPSAQYPFLYVNGYKYDGTVVNNVVNVSGASIGYFTVDSSVYSYYVAGLWFPASAAGTTYTNAEFMPVVCLADGDSEIGTLYSPSNRDLYNMLPNKLGKSLGRNITSRLSTTLYDEIYTGNFSNIKPGDYIYGPSTGARYFIAHRDPFYGFYSGTDRIGSVASMHHVAIWPATDLGTRQGMNATNTTEGGYWNSAGREYVDQLAEDYFVKDFGDHIKPFGSILSTATSDGLASAWEWKTGRKADLLSEINVYGSIVWGNGKQNVGIQKEQFEIFRDLGTHVYGNDWFWLKDVVNSANFAVAINDGRAAYNGASGTPGFRPFAILAK